jgi:hypothetical protein
MQSLEHRALAQTARTQFKKRQQSMARFHPSHLHSRHNPDFGLPRLPSGRSLELEGQTGRNLCDGTGDRYHAPSSLPRHEEMYVSLYLFPPLE